MRALIATVFSIASQHVCLGLDEATRHLLVTRWPRCWVAIVLKLLFELGVLRRLSFTRFLWCLVTLRQLRHVGRNAR